MDVTAVVKVGMELEEQAAVPVEPRWDQTANGWEAQLGDARLIVLLRYGRYIPIVQRGHTRFTECGFGLRIWAMWRAEAIARAGGRGGRVP